MINASREKSWNVDTKSVSMSVLDADVSAFSPLSVKTSLMAMGSPDSR